MIWHHDSSFFLQDWVFAKWWEETRWNKKKIEDEDWNKTRIDVNAF